MPMTDDPRRSRTVVGLLVLASITVLTLDARHDSSSSPVDALRTAVGSVLGPVEKSAAAALQPVTSLPDRFGDVHDLRLDNQRLQATNRDLHRRLNVADVIAHRASEVNGLARFADTSRLQVVAAQVIAMGSAQSFSRTVTIDAGTADGVRTDLTVVDADGLVGRVLEATRSTATVLLIVDAKSTVGGRLGDSMELGFLDGDGDVGNTSSLGLSLVDHTVTPRVGDSVVTWGSRGSTPYVADVPVGKVTSVHSSPAELTQTAQVDPYVDFSSLDLVAVVTGTSPGRSGPDLAAGNAP